MDEGNKHTIWEYRRQFVIVYKLDLLILTKYGIIEKPLYVGVYLN